jgi:hypothetical protein
VYERGKREERLNARLLGSEDLRQRIDAVLSRDRIRELDVTAHARVGVFGRVAFLRNLRLWAAAIHGSERRAR